VVSITDVAEKAKVSASTVSLVLNGRAEEMRISQKTCAKVLEVSFELGYIPNLAAKKLSSGRGSSLPEIALFWTLVQNSTFMNVFLSEAQNLFDEGKAREMRFVVEPFRAGQLRRFDDLLTRGQYNGIVVPPVCDEDIEYINSLDMHSPTLMLFGETDKYSMVAVDNYNAGRKAAQVFAARGRKTTAIINHRDISEDHNVKNRCIGFLDACAEFGMEAEVIEVRQKQIRGVDSIKAIALLGKTTAEEFLARKKLPESIFIQNDILASRFVNTISEAGVCVPEELEIISFGDDVLLETCRPTLTSIQFPTVQVVREAIMLISNLLVNPMAVPVRRLIQSPVIFRESCPRPENFKDTADASETTNLR